MATIRCKSCNLVNFSTEPQCKRCKQPLSEYSNFVDQRQYQANFEQQYQPQQNQSANFQADRFSSNFHEDQFQQAPMSCVKCGGRNRVTLQHFDTNYIPAISYIGFFMGILPGLILVRLLKIKHYLSAPFCGECWQNYSKISSKEMRGVLGLFGGFFGGLFALVLFESILLMLILFVIGLGLLISGQMYKSKHSPKYKKISRKEVIIADPVIGDVSYAK